jgi:hypothetical protein
MIDGVPQNHLSGYGVNRDLSQLNYGSEAPSDNAKNFKRGCVPCVAQRELLV